jgi:hypothetical protein
MTGWGIRELLDARDRIVARGYSPKHVFRLLRLILEGNKGVGAAGTHRKKICPTDHKFEHADGGRTVHRVRGVKYRCAACGGVVCGGRSCRDCGTDNYYAIQLGLAKRIKENE